MKACSEEKQRRRDEEYRAFMADFGQRAYQPQQRGDQGYLAFMADFGKRAYDLQRRSASPARASHTLPASEVAPSRPPLPPPPPPSTTGLWTPGQPNSPRGACLPIPHQAGLLKMPPGLSKLALGYTRCPPPPLPSSQDLQRSSGDDDIPMQPAPAWLGVPLPPSSPPKTPEN
ncbi:hypothetical protein N7519_004026 [Penicillium mononematosum]|uniref:uncharacterized protein n=1 Tax=Penicillium mononematosum TaxID=268346 RepID=UPI002547FDE0|nr:uncharacterized protein N7519_004026 [Penicillium mononematosum]KAJ6189118.1 hypothetical protein N7519_004026 [Penicillium mononematosum]